MSASKLLKFSQILQGAVQDFFDGIADTTGSPGAESQGILPSKLDHEIFHLASHLGNHTIKRRIKDLLAALATSEDKNTRYRTLIRTRWLVQPSRGPTSLR